MEIALQSRRRHHDDRTGEEDHHHHENKVEEVVQNPTRVEDRSWVEVRKTLRPFALVLFVFLFYFGSDSLLLLVVGCWLVVGWLEIVICGWVGEHWMIRLLFVGGADFG